LRKAKEIETPDIMLIYFDKARELDWIVNETLELCRDLKHGLEDCYALLAPIDPGSTLVMSTPRNEKVKGTLTRVGTRIVKGVRTSTELMIPSQAAPASSCMLMTFDRSPYISSFEQYLHRHYRYRKTKPFIYRVLMLCITISTNPSTYSP
jgi:hypothetical protein